MIKMAKKTHNNEKTDRLEKICKKLKAVPLEKWQGGDEGFFYTTLGQFQFRIGGTVDESGNAQEVGIGIYDAATERPIENYEDAPAYLRSLPRKKRKR
jgi:hypothetical protein